MDENEYEIKSPIKRLGSTRKLLIFNNIRLQLNEQLRCLDVRMEAQVALVTELQDFFRRRGELELDYSKNLDKLAKSLQLRHKEQKQKREHWPLFSSFTCWQQLVTQTRNLSRDHATLSEIYSTHLVSRLAQVMEDVQRIYRRCREIGYETHEEILRVLHELHTTMKTFHSYHNESRQAETKLRLAEATRGKLEQTTPPEKLQRSKKYRLIEKEISKRKSKYSDAQLKALKARNEYLLCLEASNTTIHKYFVDDLSDLIDCMDFGFHNCISRALLMHVSAEEGRQKSVQNGMDALTSCIGALDSRLDKQRFLESNHQAFMIPKKIEFQGQRTDDSVEPEIQRVLHQEMETRLSQLRERVTNLRAESDEVWKTLETAESTLLEMLTAHDYDCSHYFTEAAVSSNQKPETLSLKLRADRHETEEFYLTKFREYLLGTTRIARLDAKQEFLRQCLAGMAGGSTAMDGGGGGITTGGGLGVLQTVDITNKPRRKRIGRLHNNGQPKLFGGSLEEYLESTNQEIPLIIKSCIRVINLYGLHHQGIFRVSGSQVEINNFREWFERGEDPLADMTDASDINSVAGVLKLYLRELREPLFPIIYFEHFMELAQLESKQEFVIKMRDLIQSLPRTVVIVMRYLFAFLNHLSEYSDENMMDPYNLAICFGPTLVPVPDDKDQVQYQNQVNELIKNIIMFNDEIFPNDGGIQYEKYISQEPEDNDVEDSPSDHVQDDVDSEVYPSEDESENMEGTVQFDFIARSSRELSLKKGDVVTLYSQVSNDWWRGANNQGHQGLIPDKYISLKMKDDDRDKHDHHLKSSSSEESMQQQRRRASSSNDSLLSESIVSTTSSTGHQTTTGLSLRNITGTGTGTTQGQGQQTATWPSTVINTSSSATYQHQHQHYNSSSEVIKPNANANANANANRETKHQQDNSNNTSTITIGSQSPRLCLKQQQQHTSSTTNVKSTIIQNSEQQQQQYSSNKNSSSVTFTDLDPVVCSSNSDRDRDRDHLNVTTNSTTSSTSTSTVTDTDTDTDTNDMLITNCCTLSMDEHEHIHDVECRMNMLQSSLPTNVVELRNHNATNHSHGHGHWKSQSVSEISTEQLNVSFSQNRELWQKRASSQSVQSQKNINRHSTESWKHPKHTPDLVMDLPLTGGNSSPKDSTKKILSNSMQSLSDLDDTTTTTTTTTLRSISCGVSDSLDTSPLPTTQAPQLGPESPDMSTAAERFAKQNQCTLKKNTKLHQDANEMVQTINISETRASPSPPPPPLTSNTGSVVSTVSEFGSTPGGGGGGAAPVLPTRSPVPTRVTHKFAAKFADMHLTGSFKPQVMAKPAQLLRKPVISLLPNTASTATTQRESSPEMQRKDK
ncbi:SLIT-ROBO Rho GTPase-activating protein 1-like isoform X2 [Chrysoperla carnea]|uniref:SLIT-ROBO Rho GTPase-activating protein 1-like isoform X2 n=1 Tax=Chrysoperla carnea TaxID=189513 RepID=UPI001D086272|nr:SLIT-ROBO Rho GTPase-activating protein 1-like isoform X2 [Chrysoperla carnea]